MQKCEIMLNDLIDSKRTNANIKASIPQTSQTGTLRLAKYFLPLSFLLIFKKQGYFWLLFVICAEQGENDVSLNLLDATIISTNFWPPIQVCSLTENIGQ